MASIAEVTSNLASFSTTVELKQNIIQTSRYSLDCALFCNRPFLCSPSRRNHIDFHKVLHLCLISGSTQLEDRLAGRNGLKQLSPRDYIPTNSFHATFRGRNGNVLAPSSLELPGAGAPRRPGIGPTTSILLSGKLETFVRRQA